MSSTTFRVHRKGVPRRMAEDEHAHAAGVIEALRKGETIAGTAYADDYRRSMAALTTSSTPSMP